MKKSVALTSGGLDSSVALMLSLADHDFAFAVTFDYGQRASLREIAAARGLCRRLSIPHEVVELPWLGKATSTALVNREAPIPRTSPGAVDDDAAARARAVWVPNRNGLFVSVAAAMAESIGAGFVVAGFNAEEARTFPDNSSGFVESTNRALSFSTMNSVVLESPTLLMTKDEIARRAMELDLAPDLFWCCYEGGEKNCGICESCARTMRAFERIGAADYIRGRFA